MVLILDISILCMVYMTSLALSNLVFDLIFNKLYILYLYNNFIRLGEFKDFKFRNQPRTPPTLNSCVCAWFCVCVCLLPLV